MRDGLLTAHDNFHDKHYMESVANGNSDYWRAKVKYGMGPQFIARFGQQAFYDFLESLPTTATHADVFHSLEHELECTCDPRKDMVCPACQKLVKSKLSDTIPV